MRVILTRHFKTQSNEDGLIMGWGDSPPCHDWEVDVNFVDARLREQGISFDGIYSSDLERSRQTAMSYARRLGISAVNSAAELNEVNYGELQNKKKTWVAKYYPQHKKNPDLVYPGGESFRQMQRRSVRYLLSLAEARPQHTVLIVAHAGVIRGIISHFLGLKYADCLERKISFHYIGDFQLEGPHCRRYEEFGKPSGFVIDGAINIPFVSSANP